MWDQTTWTAAHEQWLRAQHFERRGVQLAFDEALDAVFSVHARRDRLDTAITEMATTDPVLAGPVHAVPRAVGRSHDAGDGSAAPVVRRRAYGTLG